MTNLIFNLRIGKLHIQITKGWKLRLSLNDYHRWIKWPFVQLYEPNVQCLLPKIRR